MSKLTKEERIEKAKKIAVKVAKGAAIATAGVAIGYIAGKSVCKKAREIELDSSFKEGHIAGRIIGYDKGIKAGMNIGMDSGINMGFDIGMSTCINKRKEIKEADLDEVIELTEEDMIKGVDIWESRAYKNNAKVIDEIGEENFKKNLINPAKKTMLRRAAVVGKRMKKEQD